MSIFGNMGLNLGLQGNSGNSIAQNWSNGASGGGGSAVSNSNGWSESWGNESGSSWSAVYGKEASAADIQRAAEANLKNDEYLLAQMAYNAAEANKSREFQEYMSNTAHQREVIDLLKAGLNPILAAGGMGASTPIGAMATTGLQSAQKAQTFADQRSGSSWSSSHGSKSYNSSHSTESHGNWSKNSAYGYEMAQHTNNVKGAIGAIAEGAKGISGMVTKGINAIVQNERRKGGTPSGSRSGKY